MVSGGFLGVGIGGIGGVGFDSGYGFGFGGLLDDASLSGCIGIDGSSALESGFGLDVSGTSAAYYRLNSLDAYQQHQVYKELVELRVSRAIHANVPKMQVELAGSEKTFAFDADGMLELGIQNDNQNQNGWLFGKVSALLNLGLNIPEADSVDVLRRFW